MSYQPTHVVDKTTTAATSKMLARLGLDSIRSRLLVNVTAKNILIASGCLAASYVLAKTVGLYLKKRQYRHIPGPPPANGIVGFFIGNMPELRQAFSEGKVIGDVLVKWHETYGEVFKFQMFSKFIVVTSDKNTIKDVLIVKNYPKDRMNIDRIGCPMGERFLGNGLATEVDNERWRHRRAIYNPGFHRHVLVTFVGHFNQIVNSLLDKLRTKADGKTKVDLLAEINRATLDAIALIAFGMNTDSIMLPDSILNIYLSRILKTAFEVFLDPLYKYRPWNFGVIREFKLMIRYIRELGRKRILERVNAFKNNEHLPNDILTAILTSYKDGDLDIEAMTDDFVTFFVAGQETTANTVAFCFQELGKNPDVVKRAQEEIDRVLGKRTEITYQDVSELKYCSAIFKEVLRLFPPAPQLFRYLTEPININGYNIPKNTPIWISTYINGRYEKYFKNALEFKPERFLKSSESIEVSDVENYVYFPFSLGPRNCIGQNFAQLEGIIVIAKLLQKFDFKLDPTQKFVCDQTLTLRPRDGTRIFLTLRDHS